MKTFLLTFTSFSLFTLQLNATSPITPWHSLHSSKEEESVYEDLPPTVFSSIGRLHSVEKMVFAAANPEDTSSNVAVALQYDDGILVVACNVNSPYLEDEDNDDDTSSVTSLQFPSPYNFQVGPQIYAMVAGNAQDSQILKDKVLQISGMLWERTNGGLSVVIPPMPPSILARNIADHLQRATQQISSGKILAVSDNYQLLFPDDDRDCRFAVVFMSLFGMEKSSHSPLSLFCSNSSLN
jgi:hypothetical protein